MKKIKEITFEEAGKCTMLFEEKGNEYIVTVYLWKDEKWKQIYAVLQRSFIKANEEFKKAAITLL